MANYIMIHAFEPSAKPKVDAAQRASLEVVEEGNLVLPDPVEEINDNIVSVPVEDDHEVIGDSDGNDCITE